MSDPLLIIDAHAAVAGTDDHGGLLHAPGYYARFPEEPSPAGLLKFDAKRTITLTTTTLELVLAEMVKAGAGGTVLLICHAWLDGLLFPIVTESRKVSILTLIDAIQQITERLAIGEPIRNKAVTADKKVRQDKADEIQAFLSKQGVPPTGVASLPEAEAAYDNWREGQLKGRLGITAPDPLAVFRRLESRIAAVRALRLERVELRACEVGNNKLAMQAIKRLFGCGKLVAPKQIMFFMSGFTVFTSRDKLASTLKPLAVQIGKDEPPRTIAGQPNYGHSFDTDDVLSTTEAREFKVTNGKNTERFTLWVGELNDPFTFAARGTTAPDPVTRGVNFGTVTAFVKQAIHPGASQVNGQFPLCGMFLRPRHFVLPREAEYLSNLVTET